MVRSQVYSQHPSRCLLSVAHQHRSWASSNADMRLLEVETGERDCLGNCSSGVNLRISKEYACSGYASTSSPIKSSWIHRLIPAQVTRVEQLQLTNSLPIGREGSDGLKADWTVFKSDNGKQSGFGLYENSHEALLTKRTTCNEHVDVSAPGTGRICDVEVLQSKIQVPPRVLPVVESLLNPGCSKHELSTETNKLHNLSKSSGFSNPIKQTVHFSADDRCRVSCSSIEGFNFRSARCAAGNSDASLMGYKCYNASQPTLEYSFNYPEAASRSYLDSIYGGIQAHACTYPGMDITNGRQTGETIDAEIRESFSTMGLLSLERRYGSDESRYLDRGVMPYNTRAMPYNTRAIDSFPEGLMQANLSARRTLEDLHIDQECIWTMRNRNLKLSQEHQDHGKGTVFAFEVSRGEGSAFTGGGCSNLGFAKDGTQRVSDLVSSQFKANTREKASLSLAPCVVEQELGSSRDSHKEQDVTSGSFSFHSKGRLPYFSVDAKVALERGHWPFYETSPYIEPSVVPKDQRIRDSVEASRLGVPLNNASFMQPDLDHAYTTKLQCSPFFGTETLMEYGRHLLASKLDFLPQKLTGLHSNGVYTGESNTEAFGNHGVTQDAGIQQEKGGIMSSKLLSNAPMKEAKERGTYTHPSEAINWGGFKPSCKFSTLSVSGIECCSNRPATVATQDLATTAEARNTLIEVEGAIALPPARLGERSHSFSAGGSLNKALDGPKSGGGGLRSWDDGSVLRKRMWLKRWSTRSPPEEHSLMKLQSNLETGVVNSRHFVENNHNSSKSSYETYHHFDLRPAKRARYGQRFGLHSEPCQAFPVLGSLGFGSQNQQENGATSHFMQRFLSPSGAAMAVMGMTARKMHATQPQRRGLFGDLPVVFSENKVLTGQQEAKFGKEIWTRQKNEKDFLHSSTKPC